MSVPKYWDWRTDFDKMQFSTYAPLAAKPYGRPIEPDNTLYPVGYTGYPLNLKEQYFTQPKYWDWRTDFDKMQFSTYAPLAAKPYGRPIEPDNTLYPVGYTGYPLNLPR